MINDKVKSLFFSQYLGQKVYTCKDWESFNDKSLNEVDPIYLQCGSHRLHGGYLLLRDISQMTIAEHQMCAGYNDMYIIKIHALLGILTPFTYMDENNIPQTLQPAEIINLGWAKIKEA